MEKLCNERMDTFLNKHDILSPSQYGFRSNMSTSHALLELVEEITSSPDNKKYSVGIFIDLKKSVDTIDHDIGLLAKKKKFYNSEPLNIYCGVQHGSILGPTLFIMYINDICKVSKIFKFILFADDTNFIFCCDSDLNNIIRIRVINAEL